MGTKVQCKSYFPGYYSMRDLNEDANSGSWHLYYEDKTFKRGQHYNSLFPGPSTDGYSEYDKEMLKQTMIKHETIFRNQVFELHRLYGIQRDLMDELKRKELYKYPIQVEASQSSQLSSQMPSENAQKMWHIPSLPLLNSTCSRSSVSGADNMQSPLNFMKESSMQARHVPTQNGGSSKDCELLESKSKKLPRKMFDLQLPADEYIDSEEGEQIEEKVSQVSVVENYPLKRNCGVAPERDVKLSLASGGNPGDASKSDFCLRNKYSLADLNEPIQVEEATASASVNFLGAVTCHGEIQGRDLPARPNSGFLGLPKEFFQNNQKGRNNGTNINVLHLENEGNRREWPSYNLEAGQSRSNLNSFPQGFCAEKLPRPSQPIQVELKKAHELPPFLLADRSKGETWRESAICGREISKRSESLSNSNFSGAVVASHIPSSYPVVPHCDIASSSSTLASSWRNPMSSLNQSPVAVQALPCFSSDAQLSKSSKMSIQSPGLVADKWHHNSNLRSNSSFGSEVSNRNGFCHESQSDSNASQAHFPSVGFNYLNCSSDNNSASEHFEHHSPMKYFKGSDCMEVKSAKDMNLNLSLPNGFLERVVPQQDLVIIDGDGKNEDAPGGLPWLRMKPACNDGPAKGRGGLNQIGLGFLQAYSQEFAHKIETEKVPTSSFIQESCVCDTKSQRIEVGDCPSNKKILGFPIFEKPHISQDQSSLSSPPKLLQHPSEVEGIQKSGKVGILDIDLSRDPALSDSDQQLSTENLVTDKGLEEDLSGFRNRINLNSCMDEEEAQSTCSVPRATVKIAAEIDLEAPVVPKTAEGIPPGGEYLGNQFETPVESSQNEAQDPSEELVRIAAEAIVIISSSGAHNRSEDATCHASETCLRDSLHWFAEVVSINAGDLDIEESVVLKGKGSSDHEESSSNGFDYFESMTLKLTEIKVDEYWCKPWTPENQKEEETGAPSLPTRRRKGQARRGRQRRDFQRDILPGLASLSRHEVTEDLQTIGGLMRATGCHWQAGLARRNGARKGWARGRRRSRGPSPTVAASAVWSPPRQQPNNNEMGLEERSLTGWGKTTRRPRRQRFPTGNLPLPLTQV